MKKIFCLIIYLLCLVLPTNAADWININKNITLDVSSLMLHSDNYCDMVVYLNDKNKLRQINSKIVGVLVILKVNFETNDIKIMKTSYLGKKNNLITSNINQNFSEKYILKEADIVMDDLFSIFNMLSIKDTSDGSEWLQIFEKTWIKKESITWDNTTVTFWQKDLSSKSFSFDELSKLLGKNVWYIMSENTIDCFNNTYTQKQMVVYDIAGKVLLNDENRINTNKIIPDSRAEATFKLLCMPLLR